MRDYIAEYEIPILEDRAKVGDRAAADRLIRFYEAEIADMTIRRLRLVERLAEADRAPIYATEAEVVDAHELGD